MIRTTVIKGRIDIMLEVRFYDTVDDQLLKFAVIVSRYKGKWVFCKHKKRDTYECPGGHRENGEQIIDAAKRELWEETGAEIFDLQPVCVYSVYEDNEQAVKETFGMLYFARISSFGVLPPLEIERIELLEQLPERWTYPLIQPKVVRKVQKTLGGKA